jgi:cytochrome c oxidase subunit III
VKPAASRAEGEPAPQFGGGPPPPPAGSGTSVSNARVAIVMLLAAETMLFTGLIGAYIVLRGASADPWPPPGQPRLPLGITWANTMVLLASAWTMRRAAVAHTRKEPRTLRIAIIATACLGTAFLLIQGTEWMRLILHGLTASSSLYGATFYTLIGVHGVHVAAAVVWLGAVALRFRGDRFSMTRAAGVDVLAIYWYFVCAVWAVLFPLVYLF